MRRVLRCGLPLTCVRGFTDVSHSYLHQPHIEQTDNVDDAINTRVQQMTWAHNEQWRGYSDAYLGRIINYSVAMDRPQAPVPTATAVIDECLGYVYELYGTLAEELQALQDDVLHPRFHERLVRVRRDRERIADVLDTHYAALHPTVKTLYDATLVRRYYTLADWCTYVEQKRIDVLHRLSPAYLRAVVRARWVAEQHIMHLRQLAQRLADDPTIGLLADDNGSSSSEEDKAVVKPQYTAEELVVLRQRATYFRKQRTFGIVELESNMRL